MISRAQVSKNLISATADGLISQQTQSDMDLDDIAVAGCQGIDVDDVDAEDVTLVCVIIDASGSMWDEAEVLRRAYREQLLEPLRGAAEADSILLSTLVFSCGAAENVRVVHGYTPIPQCPELTEADYSPGGATPLYDAVSTGLTGLISYGQQLRDNGTRTKSIVVVMSDGQENASRISAAKVRNISGDVLREQEFILAYIFYGKQTEGDTYAEEIGFPARHRLTENLDGSGIRNVFGQVSASVIKTSQAQISAGGISTNAFFQSQPSVPSTP